MNGQELSRYDVLRTVDAIVQSGVLGTSDRRANLLRYLVDKELDGHGRELKAFSIAIDVLGRDASFDPNTDSIVRSEMGRLRDALRLYFAEMADGDGVMIEIPKGTYRPAISANAGERSPPLAPAFTRAMVLGLCAAILIFFMGAYYNVSQPERAEAVATRIPTSNLPYDLVQIAVAPFAWTGNNPDADELAFGIFSELSMSLSAYPWISVISPVGGVESLDSSQVDYVLIGDVHWNADTILTSARLVGMGDQQVVWGDTQTLVAEPNEIRKSVTYVTSQIAFKLGSTHGIAPELVKRLNTANSPEPMAAFICFLESHAYISEPTDSGHLALRECLLEAVSEFPSFGDGWAALAIVYLDEARFARNIRPDRDAWQDAKDAIDKALKYAPLRMPTLNVALVQSIESPEQDRVAFERYASLLLKLYPRHPPTLNNVGSRMAQFTGQWDKGLALVEEAIYLEADPPSSFYVANAYRAVLKGTAEEALSSVAPLTTQTSESQLLLRYLAAARNGLQADMQEIRNLLDHQGLGQDDDIIRHVMGRRYVNELETALVTQLENAFRSEFNQ